MINQAGVPKRPEIPAKDFAETMGMDPCAVLPFDPALFGQAANNGQMLIELQPKARVSEGMRRLAALVTGRSRGASAKKGAHLLLPFLKSKKQA